MSPPRTRVLYVTDLAYEARGRRYCDEDIFLSSQRRKHFDVALCHPMDAAALMDSFDVVVVRNTGPALYYQADYDTIEYALYAPHTDQRWMLEPYEPTHADLAFAQRFIDWNDIRHGTQRVDACRTQKRSCLVGSATIFSNV